MTNNSSVLVFLANGEDNAVQMRTFDEKNMPKELNGESGFHIYHVRMLTKLILNQLRETEGFSLSEESIEAISVASSLHDIGKSRIPKSILDFPGKLSPLEYDIVKKHTTFGAQIIEGCSMDSVSDEIKKYAKEIALYHHERYDGTGYPEGLKGEQIPLSAQVVSLADAYDALTSNRSYKDAFSQDVAIQMIAYAAE